MKVVVRVQVSSDSSKNNSSTPTSRQRRTSAGVPERNFKFHPERRHGSRGGQAGILSGQHVASKHLLFVWWTPGEGSAQDCYLH